MFDFYHLGKWAALRDYTWTPELIEMFKSDVKNIKKDPLMSKGTAEQQGRRIGTIAGLPLAIAGGALAGHFGGRGVDKLLHGLRSGNIPLSAVKDLGAGAGGLLAGLLAPMNTARLGAMIAKKTDE